MAVGAARVLVIELRRRPYSGIAWRRIRPSLPLPRTRMLTVTGRFPADDVPSQSVNTVGDGAIAHRSHARRRTGEPLGASTDDGRRYRRVKLTQRAEVGACSVAMSGDDAPQCARSILAGKRARWERI